ncbi:nuclear transport factor 2 family protein [Pseudoduganella namucuonensis]|uniref:Ketosteroid isomerase homolog n=1 Tax=Pseudoduganella namucuonensis TaxID=1035707 RepID=A0A1I7KYZ5_9BURK|nr:nuclear transport factor 2 family protein [Pseudoduganella namucuonensis]SFV02667.1 Ketosteroid isomerase homolog [Pseudoduganella namucuonensis]
MKTTEQKVEQLLAEAEISRLIYDYAYHLDMNHASELAELFVEDCVVLYAPNFGAEGRAAYAKTLEGVGSYFVATSHHVSNIVIDFDGADAAKVRTIVYAWHRYSRERPDSHVWGQYHDEVVRVDGRWRFKRRELRTTGAKDFHVKETLAIGRRG